MVNLYINQRRVGEVVVLDLKGRAKVRGKTVELHKSVRCLIDEGKTQILLDLRDVTHFDSSGLGELISCHVSARNCGGAFKFCHVPEKVQELLEITKLITVFDVYDKESEAVSSFSSQVLKVVESQPFFV